MRKRHTLLTTLFLIGCFLVSPITVAEISRVPQHEKIPDGETQLSAYFSIELTGGNWFSPLTLHVYHHHNGEKESIGISRFSESASRQNAYAISDDGKTLIYFHQNLPDDDGIDKPGGLYEYRHDGEDKRLHGFISNAVYLPIQLPLNIIVYAKLKKIKNSIRLDQTIYLRDTDGNEKLWQP